MVALLAMLAAVASNTAALAQDKATIEDGPWEANEAPQSANFGGVFDEGVRCTWWIGALQGVLGPVEAGTACAASAVKVDVVTLDPPTTGVATGMAATLGKEDGSSCKLCKLRDGDRVRVVPTEATAPPGRGGQAASCCQSNSSA